LVECPVDGGEQFADVIGLGEVADDAQGGFAGSGPGGVAGHEDHGYGFGLLARSQELE